MPRVAVGLLSCLPMTDFSADLLDFIDRSPTPYHAVAEAAQRLEAKGFTRLSETDLWDHAPGSRHYVIRNEGSLIAFEVGTQSPATQGFRILGAHTDSPNLRVKPLPDVQAHGYQQLGVEPYGGVLLHTWLDRDLSLAGRVVVEADGILETRLLDFGRPLLRIPNLAIHLNREIREKGLKINPQQHLSPLMGLADAPAFMDLLAGELSAQGTVEIASGDISGFDLMTYDTQASNISGAGGEFIQAPRLDNLASCHASLHALFAAGDAGTSATTRVVALYDHEEVGSRSAAGAAGPYLHEVLERLEVGFQGGEPQGLSRALANSILVSVDMAHAVHPNYADRHEPGHRPLIGKGPVIKVNSNQAYATDAATAGAFASICGRVDVRPQYFVSRSDLACGSTIGPISAARVGVRTVDVGNPMLSMHSCREMAGTADVEPMIRVLGEFLS